MAIREYGGIAEHVRILRADNGSEVTIGEWMRTGERSLDVWILKLDVPFSDSMSNSCPFGHARETESLVRRSARVTCAPWQSCWPLMCLVASLQQTPMLG